MIPHAFVFVCQGGDIEPQALLLAASLRRFAQCPVEIIAAVPRQAGVPPPTPEALAFLAALNVRVETIRNEVDPAYPIAHKIACFGIEIEAAHFVFLDSDMLCCRDFGARLAGEGAQFAARLTDFADLTEHEWREIYRFSGRGEPEMAYRSLITHDAMPLCFNSGVVICKQPRKLHSAWTRNARRLNLPDRFPKTRPFLDQISLPFALRDLGWSAELLTERQHFSASVFPLDAHDPPLFAHYHREPIHLLGEAMLAGIARALTVQFEGLRPLLQRDPFLRFL